MFSLKAGADMECKKTIDTAKYIGYFVIFVLIALVVSVLFSVSLKAEAADPIEQAVDYTAVLYDNTNGLPTSETNAIVQSENGYIWIGGYSGLIRYDGNSFYRYDSTSGIATVRCLFIDSRKRLWIGTNDDGAAMLEGEEFTFFNKGKGLASSSIRSIIEDDNRNIIVATTMGLTVIDMYNNIKPIDEAQINKKYILKLTKSKDGVIYGVDIEGGFFTFKNDKITGYYDPDTTGFGTVDTVYPDPENENILYLSARKEGLICWDITKPTSTAKKYSIRPQNTINNIKKINDKIWVCCDNGIGFFDKDMNYTNITDVPMTSSIDNIMQDYEGSLWFTSSRQGVMKIVENQFRNISRISKLENVVVNTTCRYKNELYVGTDNGLYILNKNYKQFTNKVSEMIGDSRVRCIIKDRNNVLWFCTYSDYGLISYDPKTEKIRYYNEDNGLSVNRIRMIKELADGRLAVSTGKGVLIIRDGEIVQTYDESTGISNTEILTIEETDDGRLYLGSDGDGIYMVDGSRISRISKNDGLTSEVVMRIKKDPTENVYWIITSNSISYMQNEKVYMIKKFPYSNNFDLYFDKNDNIWVLNSNGIHIVKKKDMLENKDIDYILYDIHSGLPFITTANSYSQLDDDGTLFISGSAGVCSININNSSEDNSKIKIGIPAVRIDDNYIETTENKSISIPADCKRLTIYANAFTYSLKNPHISYYLEGFDDNAVQMTKNDLSTITYTNLKGGKYTFHFSLVNTNTGKVDKSVSITLIKEKAVYEEAWFYIIIGLGIVLFLMLIFFFVLERREAYYLRKQNENKKLINEMSMAFSKCVESKDEYTNGHASRVAQYSRMFAERMGKSPDEVEHIYNIALLHDIGKISVPDSILNKPGRLTDEEYAIMKNHPQKGYEILKEITIEPDLAIGARYHHERIDGRGYPKGLKGDEIPEIAQIIAVADTFDAMYSTRPYRKKMKLKDVVDEIKRCTGTQLSEKVVKAFLELVEEGVFDNDDTK